jgi:monoamine oxidase
MAGTDVDHVDLAVIGGGAAGTYVAQRMRAVRPDWSIALFERTERIGGRLRSMRVAGLDHPIELGGMRFLASHRHVQDVVTAMGIQTHPFDTTGGSERSFLRGHFGAGSEDPSAGAGYDLPEGERGRSALELLLAAFERIVPGAADLDGPGWTRTRATHEYLDRPLTDWAMGEALASVLSRVGHRFVTDAFGYDSGMRAFNVGDAIEYLLGGGNPSAEARTPNDGMDAIPGALAARFEANGGSVRLGHELQSHKVDRKMHRLRFANGADVTTPRLVLTVALPALRLLADSSPVLGTASFRRVLDAVEAFPAAKLYLWFDRPWWHTEEPAIRMITDLPPRKLFYFGSHSDEPAALLAAYTDGLHTEPWRRLADDSPGGSPAPPAMMATIQADLRAIHPGSADMPRPIGSAFMLWGADPHETGWTFWRAGVRSDDVQAAAVQPDPSLDLFVCGEGFSRSQAWVEGALETADAVVTALTDRSASTGT